MSDNAFARILANLDNADSGVTEKSASATDTETPQPDPAQRMLQTVRTVSQSLKAEKTAAAAKPSVAGDLQRMAKEAQAAEADAMVKQAHFLGAAVCDGFMERYAQYDTALNQIGVKTASAENVPEETLRKVAQAAYAQAQEDMEKHAQAEFERGYNDTLEQVHKTASDIHYIGQQAAHALIKQASQQP